MKQEGHLQVFDLILETKSPLFIGWGKSYTKKEYLFDYRSKMVSFLDERMLFAYLAEHNLAEAYEGYILRGTSRNLRDFLLNECKVTWEEIDKWTRCRIDVGDALDENHSLKDIQRFIRNGNEQIYVPGSSIKGALRTVLLKEMLLKSPPGNPDPELPFDRYGSFEENYFNSLSLKKDRNKIPIKRSPLNSILRGVLISDSLPISDDRLCLTRKIDKFQDGDHNYINLCRECIKPGTLIQCKITLDQSVLQGKITKESIGQAIGVVSAHYQKTVIDRYPKAANYMNSATILLGGGVGFQSKTVNDLYFGKDELQVTSKVLQKVFRKHEHWRDPELGISPRTLKETYFDQMPYPYGVCEVRIQ